MFTETEIKIPISSEEELQRVLSQCEALYKGKGVKIFQRDEYYDTNDESLKLADLALRIRYSNGQAKIALKGPRKYDANNIYTRIELEFEPANISEVQDQISRQSLTLTAVVEKYRWKYKDDGIKITIDKLPFIGTFLEVEATTNDEIHQVLTTLQLLVYDAIRDNVTELLEGKLKDLNLPLRPHLRATFDEESKWQKSTQNTSHQD